MKIKNKKELVLRARGHARTDHITQGTYGHAEANGHVEYRGCAIGCLSTPHRQKDLRRFVLDGVDFDDDSGMVRTLAEEFGICPALARAAEAIFEGLDTHGQAIEFIPAFARALPEGVDIGSRSVADWWRKNTRASATCYGPGDWGFGWLYSRRHDAATIRDEFLDWLRGLA